MKRSLFKESMSIIFHAMQVAWQLIMSAARVHRVRMPVVTIFGGSQAQHNSVYAQQAFAFAQKLVAHDISVLTGGGPGIMEAANCGATEEAKPSNSTLSSMGIGVTFIDKEYKNPCVPVIRVDYFFLRKWLLIRYSLAFIFFPGGVGTGDELFELLNFMAHGKVPKLPIILIGTNYWNPLIQWFKESAFKHKFINQSQIDMMEITDDLEHAFAIVQETCKAYKEYVQ